MISSVNALSSSSISLLFGTTNATEATQTSSAAEKLLDQSTVEPTNLLAGANAIGKIIEIVAGMNASDALFTMDGAERIDGSDGEYSLTKTGTGTVGADANDISGVQETAKGSGPEAERAKAYLDALSKGTIQKTDMSSMGVTSTMTKTNYYYADGTDKGEKVSYSTKGMDQFLQNYTYVDNDGILRDKETGKYAGINQNGTKFTYLTY